MNNKKTILGSIGLLIGVVIAILALVRGTWQLPLLVGTFVVWGLWLLWAQVLPFRRALQVQKQRRQTESLNRQLAQTLLHHVNYRVSACLKANHPNARWEWMMRDPALFVAQGGTGRIHVYGVKDFEYADVTVDQSGKLTCSLVKMVALDETNQPSNCSNQQIPDYEVWYETQGRETLIALINDLDSRGHSALTVAEDGTIRINPAGAGKEVKGGRLEQFPPKDSWDKLAELLAQDKMTATVRNNCLAVTW